MSLDMIFPNPDRRLMAPKIMSKRNDQDVGEGKSEKPKAHLTNVLFSDPALEENTRKAFNAVEWENIVKVFNEKTGL